MAFHRNNNGQGNRHHRQHFRPRHNNNQQQHQNGQRRHVNRINHVFESTGPDGRVRGTAQQLVEKYSGLARDAHASGDTVLMLNCYQHAEHYQRLYNEIVEENSVFEREREAQRAQYQPQPNVEGDLNQGDQPDINDQPAPAASAEQPAAAPSDDQRAARQAAASSTGGRVMGRRPGPHARDNQGTSQMRDEDMPSFLKKDIPIKAAPAPVADKAVDAAAGDEPATPAAFGRVRRAPVRKPAASETPDAE